MAIRELGKLEVVDVRDVWTDEAQDFTPWLADNLGLLGEALGLELIGVQREAQVDGFSLDILAADENGALVAIENQLEETDHKHLGQLLTYAAGYGARTLIWITPCFKDAHRVALDWLNCWTPKEIAVYGVEVSVVCTGNSRETKFVPVVTPNSVNVERRKAYQPVGSWWIDYQQGI